MALVLHQLLKAALATLAVGLLILLIGTNTNYWIVVGSYHFGVWNACLGSTCITLYEYVGGVPGHVLFARIVCITSILCSLAGIGMLLVFGSKAQRRQFLNVAFSLSLVAGIFSIMGAAAYAAKEVGGGVEVGWSWGLVIWAGLLQIASAICIILPVRRGMIQFAEI